MNSIRDNPTPPFSLCIVYLRRHLTATLAGPADVVLCVLGVDMQVPQGHPVRLLLALYVTAFNEGGSVALQGAPRGATGGSRSGPLARTTRIATLPLGGG